MMKIVFNTTIKVTTKVAGKLKSKLTHQKGCLGSSQKLYFSPKVVSLESLRPAAFMSRGTKSLVHDPASSLYESMIILGHPKHRGSQPL
jgi:hypothetical protein